MLDPQRIVGITRNGSLTALLTDIIQCEKQETKRQDHMDDVSANFLR